MDPLLLTILLFGLLVVFLMIGVPIAFGLGFLAIVFTVILWGPSGLFMITSRAYSESVSFILLAVPMFLFMAIIIENTKIADDLYDMMHRWLGALPGGLASGTVVVSTIFAAMAGVTSVATVTMAMVAYPNMIKRSYDNKMVVGAIAAGGSLGIIIPPSIIAVLYGSLTGASVGKLFMGGMVPGLFISVVVIMYITIKCMINPKMGPSLPKEERASWSEKLESLKSVIMPILLIITVLGSLYSGICTPTEASAIGALGAICCAAVQRKLTWQMVKNASLRTLSMTSMILWIIIGAQCFSTVYIVGGASDMILEAVNSLAISPLATVSIMMVIIFILGMFIDPAGIIMICCPVFLPIVEALGLDPVWFGVLFILNMGIAYCSPPFGFNLFYLRGTLPDMQMTDLYKGVWPYISLIALVMILVMFFPEVAMWLPNKIK